MLQTKATMFDGFLEDLAETLDIPEVRYEEAERRYKSVGEWLHRPESTLRHVNPQVYIQGSFRLGTVIRPISDEEDYDVDLVCEVSFTKTGITQEQLKELLGQEMKAYAKRYGMAAPDPGRRCWTLNYAVGAQFHLDALPALPDGVGTRRVALARLGVRDEWASTAIAITDTEHPEFAESTQDWPHSNPKGYAEWFRSCMRVVFEERRRRMAAGKALASVEAVPEYKVKTPLQGAVQILKRHRDMMFAANSDDKPISIIITTLAAQSYRQETSISAALRSILISMDGHIEYRNGAAWIPNPTDPQENFADKWVEYPERQRAFYDWLAKAQSDFAEAAKHADVHGIAKALEPRFGRQVVATAAARRHPRGILSVAGNAMQTASSKIWRIVSATHRQAPPWSVYDRGSVAINSATLTQNGFRPKQIVNDGETVPKNANLTFEAQTDIPKPYRVYWQVVNTGDEALNAHSLRGGFDEGMVAERGNLTRNETTLYKGIHSIECFIVKDNICVARSGPFLVNIA